MTPAEEDALVERVMSECGLHGGGSSFVASCRDFIRLAIRAAVAHEQKNRHCTITGNLCLTDTWSLDNPPDCHCGRIYRKCDEDTKAAVAHERERCAKTAEYIQVDEKPDSGPFSIAQRQTCQMIAHLIRRGE